jgi:transposase
VVDGADDEEDETEDRCGAESENRAGGATGTGDCVGPRPAIPSSPEPDYAWKKQLQEQAARAFDVKLGHEAEVRTAREIERLHAKIGELTIENDFFAKRFGR